MTMQRRRNAKERSKSPKLTAALTAGSLIPQPHGGALLPGGALGNKGGTGAPANEIRKRMRMHLDEELIDACLADWKKGILTSLQVAEFCAKYAIPMQTERLDLDEGREFIRRTMHVMIDELLKAGVESGVVKQAYETATRGLG